MRYLILFLFSIIFVGCVPSSQLYRPVNEAETALFKNSRKDILPNDIKNHPNEFKGLLVHWVGIIDSSWIQSINDTSTITILGDQKYWDYIEDYSIQNEHVFLSPLGEGQFLFTRAYPNISTDSLASLYKVVADRGNLGMFYGIVNGFSSNYPVLKGVGVRFIAGKYFTTVS